MNEEGRWCNLAADRVYRQAMHRESKILNRDPRVMDTQPKWVENFKYSPKLMQVSRDIRTVQESLQAGGIVALKGSQMPITVTWDVVSADTLDIL